jgi:hypothetical protein
VTEDLSPLAHEMLDDLERRATAGDEAARARLDALLYDVLAEEVARFEISHAHEVRGLTIEERAERFAEWLRFRHIVGWEPRGRQRV